MMKFPLRRTCLALGALCLISACGQKGKLVMPVQPPPISTPYPTAAPKAVVPETSVPLDEREPAPAKN